MKKLRHWEGNVEKGKYVYLEDLLQMERYTVPLRVPAHIRDIVSPLTARLQMWVALLDNHPDQRLKKFILKGLEEGFHIGYDWEHRRKAATHNLLSCIEHPDVVQEYIQKECSLGRVLGPFPRTEVPHLHISPFGVIPKKSTGKWRLIVDLSSPQGESVNDGISQEHSSLSYVTVDMIADKVASLGKGTLLAKLDVKSAFRIVPVHPADRLLLGMQWRDSIYVDTVLPFGLRSTPKLFNVIADAIQYIARSQGVQHITHYLDDFIVLGQAGTTQ